MCKWLKILIESQVYAPSIGRDGEMFCVVDHCFILNADDAKEFLAGVDELDQDQERVVNA